MNIFIVISTIEPAVNRNGMQKTGVRAQRSRESMRDVFMKQVAHLVLAAS
jgi:hypothetical protein